ncbi:hypothetical protein Calag_1423 [Caldisphaera lagunensis DSM 15908]|uniref:DUF371 domain-containing protein n=1 Tax=Caldisphaera lagunensis (strain DSM 15908 / JCM 11604 / ANMR 0165 / IC-154) TaxID=1056495 RepID=L0ADM0_CALLD|nr:DUF371 domain-containing protein [Caldisphaera lagunensis]AFZ71130.1 hypothetical protein Calag_1423 [Caldisphaera lagunensis DSM 15908]
MQEKEFISRWFTFKAYGHKNVRATHKTTIEITKDDYLTTRGDCIIGIKSEVSLNDFPKWLKEDIKKGNMILVVFCSKKNCDSLIGYGDSNLILNNETKIIFRKSNYIEPATALIKSNKAAADLDRNLIEELKNGGELIVMITTINFKIW